MRKALVLFALLLTASALVACGGDDDSDTTTPESSAKGGADAQAPAGAPAGATIVQLSADPSGALAFETDQLDAKPGSLAIDFTNPAPIGHDVAVEDASGKELGKTEVITDSSAELKLSDLKPGEYTFYCSVPGHREGGMEGTLTVK